MEGVWVEEGHNRCWKFLIYFFPPSTGEWDSTFPCAQAAETESHSQVLLSSHPFLFMLLQFANYSTFFFKEKLLGFLFWFFFLLYESHVTLICS